MYEILRIKKNSTIEEVHEAYKKIIYSHKIFGVNLIMKMMMIMI